MLIFACTLAFIAVVIVVAYWITGSSIDREVDALVAAARPPVEAVVTEARMSSLPEPAQRYLRHAGIEGSKIPRLVHLTQKGRIRGGIDSSWMAFEATEVFSTNNPAFVWRASLPTKSMPFVLGRDIYSAGRSGIRMKLLGLLTVADEHGDALQAAGLMRYLNEMSWFPAALLAGNVDISERDEGSFNVRLRDRGLVAEAVMFVDQHGRLIGFRAERFNTATRAMQTWETPITEEAMYSGMVLPRSGSAIWRSSGGDVTYIELEVTSVRYED